MNNNKKSNISHKIKHRQKPKDKFYTPLKLAKELIALVPLEDGDVVLDPCMGKGAFYEQYPNFVKKDYCEIDLGIDFFKYEKRIDWIITNPPYSILDKWFEKTCQICKKGFGYLIGLDNYTAKRMELCNNYGFGLTKMHLFKVFKWFGMSCFVIFEKGGENIITYNRIVWREDKYLDHKKLDSFF